MAGQLLFTTIFYNEAPQLQSSRDRGSRAAIAAEVPGGFEFHKEPEANCRSTFTGSFFFSSFRMLACRGQTKEIE